MRLAPEGRPFLAIAAAILLGLLGVANALGGPWWFGVLVWGPMVLWVAAFFRDPVRDGHRDSGLVIAPADGRVVGIEDVEEREYLGGPATRVSVFMNVFNVHVNRHPIDGEVEYREYRPGRFFNATLDKASSDNERMSLGIRCDKGPVLVRQIAGLVARRIVTDHQLGDRVNQGERLGLIRFGSRVDTYVPHGTRVLVQVGDQTSAGLTVLAEWPR